MRPVERYHFSFECEGDHTYIMDACDANLIECDSEYAQDETLCHISILEDRLKRLEGQIMQARYPGYTRCHARLRSFLAGWPNFYGPTPKELAAAGFFYLGRKDQTQCFYCGVKLERWRMQDCAIDEHKKFSPRCKYLELISSD